MNLYEALFWAVVIGTGIGLGFGFAQHHGTVGFILGLVGGVTGIFILLGVVRFLLPKKPLVSARERNRRIHEMRTIHIFRDDLDAEQTWELLDWCIGHGATDFTVAPMGIGSTPSTILRQLEPFSRGKAKRRLFGGKVKSVPLWELKTESVA